MARLNIPHHNIDKQKANREKNTNGNSAANIVKHKFYIYQGKNKWDEQFKKKFSDNELKNRTEKIKW